MKLQSSLTFPRFPTPATPKIRAAFEPPDEPSWSRRTDDSVTAPTALVPITAWLAVVIAPERDLDQRSMEPPLTNACDQLPRSAHHANTRVPRRST